MPGFIAGFPVDNSYSNQLAASMVRLREPVVVTGTAGNIRFAEIPQDYTHLEIVFTGRGTAVATEVALLGRLNLDAGSNYDTVYSYGSASSAGASTGTSQTALYLGAFAAASAGTAFQCGCSRILIPFYSRTDFERTSVAESFSKYGTSSGNLAMRNASSAWRSTAPVTVIDLIPSSGLFAANSVATIYGIR